MKHFPRLFLLASLLAAIRATAAGLPDTGQITCYNDTAADGVPASSAVSIARDTGAYPRQDCRFGRDAAAAGSALPKAGAGVAGFDYTKVGNNGALLAASATPGTSAADWACTRDNATGLTWEVKTTSPTDLRYFGHTYSWYNTDAAVNGGGAGAAGTNTCSATLPGNQCNTQAFVAAVNAAALCTYADWRMPTTRELQTLVRADGSSPALDQSWFPNTTASSLWTASTYADNADRAWIVNFQIGNTPTSSKSGNPRLGVRLVRGGQF